MQFEFYILKKDGKTEFIDIKNFDSDADYMSIIEAYIKNTYSVNPTFCRDTKKVIEITPQLKSGIYVFDNMSIYKKTQKINNGIMYNTYDIKMEKIGKIIAIKKRNNYEKKQSSYYGFMDQSLDPYYPKNENSSIDS